MMRKSTTWHLTCFLAALSALTLITPTAYAEIYSVGGLLDMYAYNDASYRVEHKNLPQTSLSDFATVTGSFGDNADGAYYANLATGSLGTRAYAYSDYDEGSQSGGASSTAYTTFTDTLTFSIPAGTTDDLYVTLNGHLDGTIGTGGSDPEHLASATQEWYFRLGGGLGSDEFDSGLGTGLCTDPVTNTDFSLTAPIFKNGYLMPLTLMAYLKSKASAPTQEGSDAWADVDFSNTGRFLSLDTPDGVTWESDSGVFLS